MFFMFTFTKTGKYDRSRTTSSLGYSNYKDVKFKYIDSIHIDVFRSLKNRNLKLGKYLTLITGKNGTMKSSILGLIAHPFSSPNNAKDLYGHDLKTDMRNVFRLSLEKDSSEYIYYINAITTKDEKLSEPVRVYLHKGDTRHRITVGPDNIKGQGNFSLNTSYLNLKRLVPIIDTAANVISDPLNDSDHQWISHAYDTIMQRSAYTKIETISDKKDKNTCAPANSYYDFNSISSGEDNLGTILYKMLSFVKNKNADDCLQGIFCIDEIEASLHPVAQVRLLDFLYDWSKKNHVQTIVTTHSLYLIDHCLRLQLESDKCTDYLTINNISTMQVGGDNNFNVMINPDFKTIYRELTYNDVTEPSPYKVFIICEDDIASHMLKRILKKRVIIHNVEFITDISGSNHNGTSYKGLLSLVKNGQKLLSDSIVIVDPDVDDAEINRCHYEYVLKIPDINNNLWAIERRLAYYLIHLDGANDIFATREKTARIADLNNQYIHLDNVSTVSIDRLKNWEKENKSFFNKLMYSYISDNKDTFECFATKITTLINKRRESKALPPL